MGDFGTILTTDNGGTDWKKLKTSTSIDFFDVSIKDSIVLCVGESGTIYRYTKWVYSEQPDDSTYEPPDSSDEPPDSINQIPTEYKMGQNYPNPFNANTTIDYQILNAGFITLKIYDLLGAEVSTLINEEKPAGYYSVNFDLTSIASGIYLYRLQAGSFVETKKMILLK